MYYTENGVTIDDEHITLHEYQVFARDAYYMEGKPELDFTGTRIVATKPVSVYSGNGAAIVYAVVTLCFSVFSIRVHLSWLELVYI